MKTIPIAFAFDNNLSFPVSVTITSLLSNAGRDTFYDIFILYSEKEYIDRIYIDKVESAFSNCRVQYRPVPDFFDSSYEIRGITTPAYFRLMIPEIIPEYGKVIYSDVDVIFRSDLVKLYEMDLDGYYIGATFSIGMNLTKAGKEYLSTMPELVPGEYIQSGFLVINSDLLRKDNVVTSFKKMAGRKLKFQDQDILNIVCKGRIIHIPPMYNMTNHSYEYFLYKRDSAIQYFTNDEMNEAMKNGTIHFNGQKPWKDYCANFDQWWEYYRKSPVFDEKYYFEFFNSKLDALDKLSLKKRIKILARYFIVGKK